MSLDRGAGAGMWATQKLFYPVCTPFRERGKRQVWAWFGREKYHSEREGSGKKRPLVSQKQRQRKGLPQIRLFHRQR